MRGLKFNYFAGIDIVAHVALLVSAWIEIDKSNLVSPDATGRTPCECVD